MSSIKSRQFSRVKKHCTFFSWLSTCRRRYVKCPISLVQHWWSNGSSLWRTEGTYFVRTERNILLLHEWIRRIDSFRSLPPLPPTWFFTAIFQTAYFSSPCIVVDTFVCTLSCPKISQTWTLMQFNSGSFERTFYGRPLVPVTGKECGTSQKNWIDMIKQYFWVHIFFVTVWRMHTRSSYQLNPWVRGFISHKSLIPCSVCCTLSHCLFPPNIFSSAVKTSFHNFRRVLFSLGVVKILTAFRFSAPKLFFSFPCYKREKETHCWFLPLAFWVLQLYL